MVVVKWCKKANETNATRVNANTMVMDLLSPPRRAFFMVIFASYTLPVAEMVLTTYKKQANTGDSSASGCKLRSERSV